ncbi:MAG: DUF2207 domain-containing protein [Anaerolineae bacterium]
MKNRIRIFLFPLLAFIVLILVAPANAQTPDLAYVRYDVDIALHEDGRFTVSEIQQIRFGGSFSTGFAEIPLALVSDIENVRVAGGPTLTALTPYRTGSGPLTYSVDREGDSLYVDWEYPETQAGDELIFVVQYDVVGGLWVYEDVNTLEWRAVPEDRSGLDVAASRVTVTLPFTLSADELDARAFGPANTVGLVESKGGQRIIFEAQEPVADGTAFQVLVNFPPGLVTAVAQPWQIAEDEADLAYAIDQIDIAMTVQADGRLAITEQQQVSVSSGALYTGSRDLNWLYSDGITSQASGKATLFSTRRLAAWMTAPTVMPSRKTAAPPPGRGIRNIWMKCLSTAIMPERRRRHGVSRPWYAANRQRLRWITRSMGRCATMRMARRK